MYSLFIVTILQKIIPIHAFLFHLYYDVKFSINLYEIPDLTYAQHKSFLSTDVRNVLFKAVVPIINSFSKEFFLILSFRLIFYHVHFHPNPLIYNTIRMLDLAKNSSCDTEP